MVGVTTSLVHRSDPARPKEMLAPTEAIQGGLVQRSHSPLGQVLTKEKQKMREGRAYTDPDKNLFWML